MQRIYEIGDTMLVVENVGEDWVARVSGSVTTFCERGLEHVFEIDCTVHMDARLCNTDLALLNAYEWAIRGQDEAARRLATLITDDEMYRLYVDPCEVNA